MTAQRGLLTQRGQVSADAAESQGSDALVVDQSVSFASQPTLVASYSHLEDGPVLLLLSCLYST